MFTSFPLTLSKQIKSFLRLTFMNLMYSLCSLGKVGFSATATPTSAASFELPITTLIPLLLFSSSPNSSSSWAMSAQQTLWLGVSTQEFTSAPSFQLPSECVSQLSSASFCSLGLSFWGTSPGSMD
ncbi:hypothetical protein V8G54_035871 [Vigna mungo]|uniref:Uncharacterized protein n=1 Tax=Vigna mungo TaxID=3915 RepID=A0AAQ3RF24_VIGMU